MKYKYFDGHGRIIAESDSLIKFNKDLFPLWATIEPVIESKTKTKTSAKKHWEEDKGEDK